MISSCVISKLEHVVSVHCTVQKGSRVLTNFVTTPVPNVIVPSLKVKRCPCSRTIGLRSRNCSLKRFTD